MAKTVVGLFESSDHAQQAVYALEGIGIPTNNIRTASSNLRTVIENYGIEGRSPVIELPFILGTLGSTLGLIAGVLGGMGFLATARFGLVPPGGSVFTPILGLVLGSIIGGVIGAILGVIIGFVLRILKIGVAGEHSDGAQVVVQTSDTLANAVGHVLEQHDAVFVDQRNATDTPTQRSTRK